SPIMARRMASQCYRLTVQRGEWAALQFACHLPQHEICLSPKPRNLSLFCSTPEFKHSSSSLFQSILRWICSGGCMGLVPGESFLLGVESFLLEVRVQALKSHSFLLNGRHGKIAG